MEDYGILVRLKAAAEDFNDESWRGRVLMACGLIEEALKDLIAGFMTEASPQKKIFDGEQAPLGSLGARSWVAQSLGLISAEEARDLEIIRKIRNKFAHQLEASFEREDIRDRCNELRIYRYDEEEDTDDPAHQFMNSALVLLVALPLRAQAVKKNRCAARSDRHWAL